MRLHEEPKRKVYDKLLKNISLVESKPTLTGLFFVLHFKSKSDIFLTFPQIYLLVTAFSFVAR